MLHREVTCEKHPERIGMLAVDLRSLSIKRYLCAECSDAIVTSLTQYKGKREAWMDTPIQDERSTDQRLIYPEMAGLQRNYEQGEQK